MTKNAARQGSEQPRATASLSPADPAAPAATAAGTSVGEAVLDPSGGRLSWRERASYGVGDVGGNLIFGLITSFLLFYLTDTVGISAAIAGTLLLLGRVLDGTMDLILGTFIDKTSTRWGKARPWILLGAPLVVVTFVLLFSVPSGLSQGGKEVFAFVFYFLCLGVGFVATNLAYHTLLSVITSNSTMRVSLTVLRTICGLVTGLAVNVLTLPVIDAFGGGQAAWRLTAVVYGAIALITFLVVFFGTRERVIPVRAADRSDKRPFRQLVGILGRNPYFYLGFIFFLLVYLGSGSVGSGVYFTKDVLGDPGAYSLLSFATLGPLVVGIWFMPAIIARFGKRLPILVGVAITLVGVAITFIDTKSLTVVLIGSLVRAVGSLPTYSAMYALIADVVDYGEWKSGVRVDGMTYAAATAGQNFGAGLGAGLVGWLLAAGGYDAQATTQSTSAISAETFLYLGLPGVIAVFTAVVIYFMKLDKHMPQMHRDLAARRVASAN